jgi:hypothetical protein
MPFESYGPHYNKFYVCIVSPSVAHALDTQVEYPKFPLRNNTAPPSMQNATHYDITLSDFLKFFVEVIAYMSAHPDDNMAVAPGKHLPQHF